MEGQHPPGQPDIMHAFLWPCSSAGQSAALSRRRSPVQVRSGSRCCVHSESRRFFYGERTADERYERSLLFIRLLGA